MTVSPPLLLLMIAAGIYVAKLWHDDLRSFQRGTPNPRALPGATPAPLRAHLIAAGGALSILAAETAGESLLGLTAQQTKMTVLYATYTLVAAVIEEIIFRGFIVIEGRGVAARSLGIVGASVLFAALHPFLWRWHEGTVEWSLTAKGWFSTLVVFGSSLWFYVARFASWNPQHSLGPCITAHATKNAGVFLIKAAQGFVGGWW